jgi:two-component system, NarL family, sensor kinase
MSAAVLEHPLRRSTDAVPEQPVVWLTRRALVGSIVAAVVLVVVAGAVTVSIFRKISDRRVFDDVEQQGELAARVSLAPLITHEFLASDTSAVASMNTTVDGLMRYSGVGAVAISDDNGKILWSTDPDTVGHLLNLEHLPRIDDSMTAYRPPLDIESASPDHLNELSSIDVHSRFETMEGDTVIVSVSYPYHSMPTGRTTTSDALLPVLGGSLLLLTAILVPVGLAVPRHSKRQRRERDRLLERLIASSDAERRRIAGEVHDGAVQDLVGVSFALGAAANEAPAPLDTRLHELAATTRTTVGSLRSLLNSIYPVQVPPQGWLAGLDDLVTALGDSGVTVVTDVPRVRYSPLNELLMLRVAREALRNVAAHAEASTVRITVEVHDPVVRLTITDDGVGFEQVTARAQREAGHLGLQLVRDLACEMGATLTVDSAPGSGTVVGLELKEEDS